MGTDEYVLGEPRPEGHGPWQRLREPCVDEPTAPPEELLRYATVFDVAAAELAEVIPRSGANLIAGLRWSARYLRPPYPTRGPVAFDDGGPLGARALSRMAAHHARELAAWRARTGYGDSWVRRAHALLKRPDRLDELLRVCSEAARTAAGRTP